MDDEKKERRLMLENQLVFSPTLACLVGLNGAIVLQQLHYWLTVAAEKDNNRKDGYYWTYNSITEWKKQFPFWHENTIRNAFEKLVEKELIITGTYNKRGYDRTKWYRINYPKLKKVLSPSHKDCEMDLTKLVNCDLPFVIKPIPDISLPENKTDTSLGSFDNKTLRPPIRFSNYKDQNSFKDEIADAIDYFLDQYEERIGTEHPMLSAGKWEELIESLFTVEFEHNNIGFLDEESLTQMVDRYLSNFLQGKYNADTPNICHFNNPKIKKNLFYKAAYYD